jgi:hypothetical protein
MPQWAAHYNPFNAFVVRAKKKKEANEAKRSRGSIHCQNTRCWPFFAFSLEQTPLAFFFGIARKRVEKRNM